MALKFSYQIVIIFLLYKGLRCATSSSSCLYFYTNKQKFSAWPTNLLKLFSWLGFLHHIWHSWCSCPVHLLGCWFQECSGKASLWLKMFLSWSCQKWYNFNLLNIVLAKISAFHIYVFLFHLFLFYKYVPWQRSILFFISLITLWTDFYIFYLVIPLHFLTALGEYFGFQNGKTKKASWYILLILGLLWYIVS